MGDLGRGRARIAWRWMASLLGSMAAARPISAAGVSDERLL